MSVGLVLTLTACGGGGDGDSGSVAPGQSYLQVATSSGRLFRWTPLTSGPTELYVELHDAPSELPSSFGGSFPPSVLASWVDDAAAAWESAAGTTFALELASHAAGESHGPDRTAIHVSFVQKGGSGLEGDVTMYAGATQDEIALVELVVRVPINGGELAQAGYRSLIQHEFGHALGIIAFVSGTSHSPYQGDVMYPVTSVTALSSGDRATLAELYTLVPDLLRADAGGLLPSTLGPPSASADGWWNLPLPIAFARGPFVVAPRPQVLARSSCCR